MSHFSTVRTVLREQPVIEEALRALHHRFQVGERLPIRGYQGDKEYGQIVVETGCSYDIGFQRQADGTFGVCADWSWGVERNSPVRQASFLADLNRTYTHLVVRRQVLEDGYLIEEERISPNGEIELVVCEAI